MNNRIEIMENKIKTMIFKANPGIENRYFNIQIEKEEELYSLHITHIPMTKIPKSVFDYIEKSYNNSDISMNFININLTNITRLPDSIGDLPNLYILDLSHNKLEILPDSISDLDNLDVLFIHNNKLTTLPDSIGNFRVLTVLDLSHNKLVKLPDTIGNIQSLDELNLKNNKLTTLPDSISKLSKLKKLTLTNNPIQKLHKSLLKFLPKDSKGIPYIKLENYEISDTQLKSIIAKTINSDQMKGLPTRVKQRILNNVMEESKNNGKHIINGKLYPLTDKELKEIQAKVINKNNQVKQLPDKIKRKILSESMQMIKKNNYVYFGLKQKTYKVTKDTNIIGENFLPNGNLSNIRNENRAFINTNGYVKKNGTIRQLYSKKAIDRYLRGRGTGRLSLGNFKRGNVKLLKNVQHRIVK